MRLMLGAAIVSIALVGGCRQTDEAVKAKLRTDIMQGCTTKIAPQAATQPGFDGEKYCTCITDEFIGTQDVAALKKLLEDKAATAAQGNRVATKCLAQQTPNGASAQAAAVPAGTQATVPLTPAPIAAEKVEAVSEADEASPEDTDEDSQ